MTFQIFMAKAIKIDGGKAIFVGLKSG